MLLGQLQHTYLDTGSYQVLYSVTSIDGCVASVSHTIIIDPAFLIYIPTAFTPNRDGHDDVFTVVSENLVSLEVLVFNRWGALLRSWKNISGYWDGRTAGGGIVPDGSYPYIIKYSYKDGSVLINKKKYGHVTLLR